MKRQQSKSERTCVGCRAKSSVTQLLRLQSNQFGDLKVFELVGGRGAWLCLDSAIECFDAAVKSQNFQRSLRRNVTAESISLARKRIVQICEIGSGDRTTI